VAATAAGTRFRLDDDSVAVVIGSGAGGAVVAHELCRKGKRVVLLEAGGHVEPADYKNDEFFAFQQLTWLDPRTSSGSWGPARTAPGMPAYTAKVVGGTTVIWGALSFRIQAHELLARSTYGNIEGADLVDWPVTLEELEPWWSIAEDRMGVTGTHGIPLLPVTNSYKVLHAGARRLGYTRVANDRHAINSRLRDGRPRCRQLGFCGQGCKMMAKWSTSYTEIPAALETGNLDLRSSCMALRLEQGADGRVSGVLYADAEGRQQFQKAALVIVAANAVETPRLLLNSASGKAPQGLANGAGLVGRFYTKHMNGSLFGLFEKKVEMNRGVTMSGTVYDESVHDPRRGFAGGYLMQGVQVGVPYLAAVIRPDGWGRDFTRFIERYDHLAGVWQNGEDLPLAGNRVSLNTALKDRFGLPVAHVHVDEHPNDVAMRDHFYVQSEALMRAAGAVDVMRGTPVSASHNMGTCRMSANPAEGVTDPFGRSHEVPNLFVCDGSLFPTSTSENPTLTIVALAMRMADHIVRNPS
jgi:choline dehydrogenase-like flavoprotein